MARGRSEAATGRGPLGPLPMLAGWVTAALDAVSRVIVVTTLSTLFLALLVNVVLRYAFGSGIAWAYEIHAVLLPWLVAAGIVIASARSRQITVSLLPDALSPGAVRGLLVVTSVIVLAISVSVVWTSQPILKASQFQRLSTLGITQVWGYSSLVYAFAGVAVIMVMDIIRLLGAGAATPLAPEAQSLS
ncbi:TRAP transporter small permease [Acuticoccus sp. I52.16.1]|uniref:TRAP transporter small permease n=1 Tax=Acuticoccus sp. I52.16.1 TaxID=2928472 RepID=UPI001FD21495|nr:TRAP transporter small permease subunit [Acuticoccus sp. I52.16.1]UOM32613.1 TRAP transporter small permease subunit [Acuticoccus sp. I52.16.1]